MWCHGIRFIDLFSVCFFGMHLKRSNAPLLCTRTGARVVFAHLHCFTLCVNVPGLSIDVPTVLCKIDFHPNLSSAW